MSYVGGLLFSGVIYTGFKIFDYVVLPIVGSKYVNPARLPYKASRLEKLAPIDQVAILVAKLITIMFVYHCITFVMNEEVSGMVVNLNIVDILKSIAWWPLHMPFLFIFYDFFYTLWHWALHWPPIYPWIHKHHHRNLSPFRGNDDAVNTHPVEYIVGEYLHLFSVYALTLVHGPGVHAFTFLMFIFIGGSLASLNHTRIDVRLPYLFNVWAHDFHHRQPRCNFGQYIMLWDCVFGTFRQEPADKVKSTPTAAAPPVATPSS